MTRTPKFMRTNLRYGVLFYVRTFSAVTAIWGSLWWARPWIYGCQLPTSQQVTNFQWNLQTPSPPEAEPDGVVTHSQAGPSVDALVRKLIEELGSEDFATREAAEKELIRIGVPAYELLLEALDHPDPEVVARARYILRIIPTRWDQAEDAADLRELLGFYETGAPEVRRRVLRILAGLGRGRGWAPLARLARFERDPLWARLAAVELIMVQPIPKDSRAKYGAVVRRVLGDTSRAPACWPVVFHQLMEGQPEAIDRWRQIVLEEQRLLASQPDRTSPTVLASLWAFQALADKLFQRADEAHSSFERMRNLLLPELFDHLQVMVDLSLLFHNYGMNEWAESELRRAIAGADPRRSLGARQALAELLFDQGQPLAGAQVLEPFFKLLQERQFPLLDSPAISPGQVRSRMYYFLACHWKEQGDRQQHERYLQAALQQDPQNLDALIARWEIPELRQETEELILRAKSQLERFLNDSTDPEDRASYLNQLAWLVGNTGGDLNQALQWAEKAVELHPESAAYWDTLAHVHFHRKEWDKAVEAQSRAVALQPGSGFLRRQLELFRRALEEHRNP